MTSPAGVKEGVDGLPKWDGVGAAGFVQRAKVTSRRDLVSAGYAFNSPIRAARRNPLAVLSERAYAESTGLIAPEEIEFSTFGPQHGRVRVTAQPVQRAPDSAPQNSAAR